ncbi:MAG: DNA topoisomerase IB [Acidimicrobiales bacterium]
MASRLRRADCTAPGIRRRRAGRGFTYVDAAGIDARGRKQYRYHDLWRERRDREKFDHMVAFAGALPGMRRRVAADLAQEGITRQRVLATATRLLDLGFFRIGTEGYAEENQTYGLATMHRSHVRLLGDGVVTFDYVAKSGKRRIQSVVDPEVYAVVEVLKRRRGGRPDLLAWKRGHSWVDVRSGDINDYVKEATGGDFTAKDFRTWNATVLAAVALAVSSGATSPTARKRAVTRAVKEVAHYLGNTPAVCRSSYIDPRVFDRYRAGETITAAVDGLAAATGDGTGTLLTQGAVEAALLSLLDVDESRAAA